MRATLGKSVDEPKARTIERIAFRGHPSILSLHPRTIEITTEETLTERGDCIIGVGAEMGCSGLSGETKDALRRPGSVVAVVIMVGLERFVVTARGDPELRLSDGRDIVIRKSRFISDRTLAVGADHAACDIPRNMVAKLRNPRSVGYLEVEVKEP